MAHRPRIKYSPAQKADIWDRWQRGESMCSIGRVFDRYSTSIYWQLARTGGIRPPPRRRSRLALTLPEREEISRGIVCDLAVRTIAIHLGRSPSTISREINRNGGLKRYRASQADQGPGIEPIALNPVNLQLIQRSGALWRESSDATGRPSKSLVG